MLDSERLADDLLRRACQDLGFDPASIFAELQTQPLSKIIVHHLFTITQKPYEHSVLAGAMAMWDHYRRCPVHLSDYLKIFQPFLCPDVHRFMEENLEVLQNAVEFYRDFRLTYFAVGTLIDMYLSKVHYSQPPSEIPQFCWLRVACGLFYQDGIDAVLKIFKRYIHGDGVPASPTIFNMGFKDGAPASCMIFAIDDSLDDIYDVLKEGAIASKNNAGLGVDFSGLRHSGIGRYGKGKGIIPLLKIWDQSTEYVNQGGRRKGATTASLRLHHYDLPEFIRLPDKVGESTRQIHNIQTSLMFSDLFMKRCLEGGKWTLFCPKQTGNLYLLHGREFEEKYVQYEKKAQCWARYSKYLVNPTPDLVKEFSGQPIPEQIDSREFEADSIMDEICEIQTKVSVPYVVHGCNINRKNNMCNVGPVRSANLCQEVMIPAVPREQTGCCNLASISLKAMLKGREIDYLKLAECTQDLTRALNRVIDHTANVSEKVRRSNHLNRPIGLGVSGFGSMLYLMKLPVVDVKALPKLTETGYRYADLSVESPDYTETALKRRVLNPAVGELTWKIWSCMYYNALKTSMEEAKKFGPYPNFWTSPTAQGRLQYHLWQEEERETGRKYPFKLVPAEPGEWGQEGTWEELIKEIQTHGLRNALLLTCMPTASTAQILENTEKDELYAHNIYVRKVLSGDYPDMNFEMVEDLKRLGIWNEATYNNIVQHNGSILYLPEEGLSEEQTAELRFLKELYLTMWEVPQRVMIELAAIKGPFLDHSNSLNIYMKDADKDKLKAVHTLTWQRGLKTGMYYLRTRASVDALKVGMKGETCQLDMKGQCTSCQ